MKLKNTRRQREDFRVDFSESKRSPCFAWLAHTDQSIIATGIIIYIILNYIRYYLLVFCHYYIFLTAGTAEEVRQVRRQPYQYFYPHILLGRFLFCPELTV